LKKKYKIDGQNILPLAENNGGCMCSIRITVDGAKVGFMYREDPDNELDSGWRFFAGDESDSYTANAENVEIYDVNTIANYDQRIIPLLDSPSGSAFIESAGRLIPDKPPKKWWQKLLT
jgi:hypothetical protein